MTMENLQPNEALELSAQELDEVAGGAVEDIFGKSKNVKDSQVGFVNISRNGITSFTAQETIFSEEELAAFRSTGNPIV